VTKKLVVISSVIIFIFLQTADSLAHAPHDVVADIQLSPTFSSDKTIFALVYWSFLKSTNGGYEWLSQSKGLCSHPKISLALSSSFSIDKTLFVSCFDGEVYRSQDAGQSWVPCIGGLPKLGQFVDLVTSPHFGRDHTVLALDAQGAIYQSADRGESWERVFHQECTITAVEWVDDLVIFGTDSGALYTSENSGITWQKYCQYPAGQKITCIELSPRYASDRLFFIGTEKEGVVRVINGGSTFQKATGDISDRYITSLDSYYEAGGFILFASTWHEGILRSEDNGVTWNQYDYGLLKNKQANEYITPHFSIITIADDTTIFLGGFCGIFRSNDRAQSWYKLETLLDLIVGIDIVPLTNATFTVGITTYGRGIYSTSNDSLSWNINNCGLVNARIGPIAYSPHYAEDKTVFAGCYGHIVKSRDGGTHWSAISVVPPKFSVEGAKYRIKNRLRQAIFEAQAPLFLRKFLSKLVQSWLKINISYKPWIPLGFAISPNFSVDQTVFVSMYPQGLLRSLDGGSTFSTIWNGFGNPLRSLAISPTYNIDHLLFASLKNGIYRSRDSGESWEQIGDDFDLGNTQLVLSPDYTSDHTLFAGGSSGLFRTRDGGNTWKKLTIGTPDISEEVSGLAISPSFGRDRQILVQIKRGDLFICRDFEDRFEALPSTSAGLGYEFSPFHGRDAAPLIKFSPYYSEDRTVFAVSMQKLVKSIDGGMTWKEIPRPLRYESEASIQKWLVLPIFLEGEWKQNYHKEYSASWSIYATKTRSEATLRFIGSGVKWIGSCGPDQGLASVFIDEKFQKNIDLYSEDRRRLVELFSIQGLPLAPHVITIKVDGTSNERSSGTRVEIDAFDVSKVVR